MSYSITEEELKEYIPSDIAEKIYSCIITSIQQQRTDYKELNYRHSARTTASIIHDLIVDNVKKSFPKSNNIFYFTQRNCFQLVVTQDKVDEKVSVIRFKKLDKNKIAYHNIKQQKLPLLGQVTLLPPETNLNAGYVMNGFDISIYITKPSDNRNNDWDCELIANPVSVPVNVVPLTNNDIGLPERKLKSKETEMEENAVKE